MVRVLKDMFLTQNQNISDNNGSVGVSVVLLAFVMLCLMSSMIIFACADGGMEKDDASAIEASYAAGGGCAAGCGAGCGA